jgi:ketosteroid isomerase-like protein
MEMRTPREVAESYWAAECRRDIDAVMDHYQEDAWYQDAGGLLRGHPEIRGFYEGSARDYPGLEVAILREFVGAPDTSAFEVYAVLTDHDGRPFEIRGLNALTVRDGKIASLRCYEDPLSPASPGGKTAS